MKSQNFSHKHFLIHFNIHFERAQILFFVVFTDFSFLLTTDKVSQTRRCCSKLFGNTKKDFSRAFFCCCSGSKRWWLNDVNGGLNSRKNQQIRQHKNCCKISSYNFLLNRERGKLLENVFPLFPPTQMYNTPEWAEIFFFLLLFFQIANRFFLLFFYFLLQASNFKLLFDGSTISDFSELICCLASNDFFFRCHCTFTRVNKFNQK